MEQRKPVTGVTRTQAERHGDYNAFLERHTKNTAGKNTDELYTPPAVYEAVLEWVKTNCPSIQGKRIMRPFRPGGDYKAEDYTGAVVIDNPPFFIEHFITRWYVDNGVPFFLFAPAITLFRGSTILDKLTYVAVNAGVEYSHNEHVQAKINTSFITNIPDLAAYQMIAAPELRTAIIQAQDKQKGIAKAKKTEYHPNIVTSYRFSTLAEFGIPMRVHREETLWWCKNVIKHGGFDIYGGAFVVSDRVAAAVKEAIARRDRPIKYYEPTPEAIERVNRGEGGTR